MKRFCLTWIAPGEYSTSCGQWLAIREYSLKYGANIWYVSGRDRKGGYGWARTLKEAAAMIGELLSPEPEDGQK